MTQPGLEVLPGGLAARPSVTSPLLAEAQREGEVTSDVGGSPAANPCPRQGGEPARYLPNRCVRP